MNVGALVALAGLLAGCGPVRRPVAPESSRPVLIAPQVIARGVVGEKDIKDWRVTIFTADGQRWDFWDEHFFYHAHVGERVRVVRYGAKLMIEFED